MSPETVAIREGANRRPGRERIGARDRIVVMPEPFELAQVKAVPLSGAIDVWKPCGLWWARGTEWIDWCRGENFHVDALVRAYRLTLDESRVLTVATLRELRAFDHRYHTQNRSLHGIDWQAVAKEYAAVEVLEPKLHSWNMPLERHMWLSTWDVSSGCLWDASVIREVEEVDIPIAEETP